MTLIYIYSTQNNSEVVSLNPFNVWITWLDFESEKLISWVKISSCGRFRVSEKALVEQVKHVVLCGHVYKVYIRLYLHVVNYERVAREVYQIYPRKGSVWAVHSETSNTNINKKANFSINKKASLGPRKLT
ncbi:unnamed protein product [Brassica napus]|uniref:(rape) hypothetical protein n=1 Tax=Brassica napus TaxID=3708 RepID=A0A816JFB7_BRANA|nr:unnamed protein product [Brassica napus]